MRGHLGFTPLESRCYVSKYDFLKIFKSLASILFSWRYVSIIKVMDMCRTFERVYCNSPSYVHGGMMDTYIYENKERTYQVSTVHAIFKTAHFWDLGK
jgi:hypothetical protein